VIKRGRKGQKMQDNTMVGITCSNIVVVAADGQALIVIAGSAGHWQFKGPHTHVPASRSQWCPSLCLFARLERSHKKAGDGFIPLDQSCSKGGRVFSQFGRHLSKEKSFFFDN
jgi:hypothetical protein